MYLRRCKSLALNSTLALKRLEILSEKGCTRRACTPCSAARLRQARINDYDRIARSVDVSGKRDSLESARPSGKLSFICGSLIHIRFSPRGDKPDPISSRRAFDNNLIIINSRTLDLNK